MAGGLVFGKSNRIYSNRSGMIALPGAARQAYATPTDAHSPHKPIRQVPPWVREESKRSTFPHKSIRPAMTVSVRTGRQPNGPGPRTEVDLPRRCLLEEPSGRDRSPTVAVFGVLALDGNWRRGLRDSTGDAQDNNSFMFTREQFLRQLEPGKSRTGGSQAGPGRQ